MLKCKTLKSFKVIFMIKLYFQSQKRDHCPLYSTVLAVILYYQEIRKEQHPMSYNYGFGKLEDQLIQAAITYPPDFHRMRELLAAGANINAVSATSQ